MISVPAITWNDQLLIGLDDVDSQHRQLIEIINRLGRLHAHGSTAEELLSVLSDLHNYTVFHFRHETDMMSSLPVNQANMAAHLKAHQGFVDLIVRAAALGVTNPVDVIEHLLAFMMKWLTHHITGVDMRMAKEILALRSGVFVNQTEATENTGSTMLIDTVSELYDSIFLRTFDILELNRKLQAYHDAEEYENALAQDIILRLMKRGELSSPQMHYWFSPATTFIGDVIAAKYCPKGRFYALVADATGHGLTAAITVLPVLSVFHAMVERCCPLGEIIAEINRDLRSTLPSGRFVAATMLCMDGTNNTAEVWIGGMPDLQLLDNDGHLLKEMKSSHLSLGIVDFDADMSGTTRITWENGNQFMMYSDGLIEATNSAGEPFGVERLGRALLNTRANQRVASVQSALTSHVGSTLPHDDISLILIDCVNLNRTNGTPAKIL